MPEPATQKFISKMLPFTGTPQAWNEIVASVPFSPHLPQTHYMQTWEWSLAKARNGWKPFPFVWQDKDGKPIAAALVLRWAVPIPVLNRKFCILYAPRGPLLNWYNTALRTRVLDDLSAFAKSQWAIYLKIDPDVALGTGVPGIDQVVEFPDGRAVRTDLKHRKWRFSKEQVETRNTILIDLLPSEDELLYRMKKKTRQNIRYAQKMGVTVREGTVDDLPLLWKMYQSTAGRTGIFLRDEGHYQLIWRTLLDNERTATSPQPFIKNLIAEVGGEPVAGATQFYFADQALGLYGMSFGTHRDKNPNYLLEWEAMRQAKALGCKIYDLYGVPNELVESDSLWDVYRFKSGFGGTVYRGLGAWDYAPSRVLYRLYIDVLPEVKSFFRLPGPPYTRRSRPNKKSGL